MPAVGQQRRILALFDKNLSMKIRTATVVLRERCANLVAILNRNIFFPYFPMNAVQVSHTTDVHVIKQPLQPKKHAPLSVAPPFSFRFLQFQGSQQGFASRTMSTLSPLSFFYWHRIIRSYL